MTTITSNALTVYRDYVTDNVPSTGPNDPAKIDIRALFSLIDTALTSAINGTLVGSAIVYAALSSLNADLAHAANTLGVVYADGTSANNGIYIKVGGSGSGSWSLTNLALPSTFSTLLNTAIAAVPEAVAAQNAAISAQNQAAASAVTAGIAQTGATTQNAGAATQAGVAQLAASLAQTSATAAQISAAQAAAAAGIANFYKIYLTYSAANSDLANIPANAFIQIIADETQSGHQTIVQKSGGVLTLALDLATVTASRPKLLADMTYYVRPGGNDSHTGLVDDDAHAFLTTNAALLAAVAWDFNFHTITVQHQVGTAGSPCNYAPVSCSWGFTGFGSLILKGDLTGTTVAGRTTWRGVKIAATGSTDAIQFLHTGANVTIFVQGFLLVTDAGNCLVAMGGGTEPYYQQCEFASNTGTHIWGTQGGQPHRSGNITISNGGLCHIQSSHGGRNRIDAGTGYALASCTFNHSFCYNLSGETVLTPTPPVDGWFQLNGFTVVGVQWTDEGTNVLVNGIYPPGAGQFLGNQVGYAAPEYKQTIIRTGVLTPAALVADTNNYAPIDASSLVQTLGNSYRVHLLATTPINITGLLTLTTVGGASYTLPDGYDVLLTNIGSQAITLKKLSGSSTAGYQFAIPADIVMASLQSQKLIYDGANAVWRPGA